jgi:hypothetical protein
MQMNSTEILNKVEKLWKMFAQQDRPECAAVKIINRQRCLPPAAARWVLPDCRVLRTPVGVPPAGCHCLLRLLARSGWSFGS